MTLAVVSGEGAKALVQLYAVRGRLSKGQRSRAELAFVAAFALE